MVDDPEVTIANLLKADSTFSSLVPGGIYTFDDTGRQGLSGTMTPNIFDGAVLKTCCLVRQWGRIYFAGIRDWDARAREFAQRVNVFIYSEEITELNEAKNRAIEVIGDRFNSDLGFVEVVDIEDSRRAEELQGAYMAIISFDVMGVEE